MTAVVLVALLVVFLLALRRRRQLARVAGGVGVPLIRLDTDPVRDRRPGGWFRSSEGL